MARTIDESTLYPDGWLDFKKVKPKLGEAVLVAMKSPTSGSITYAVGLYAKRLRDLRVRAFFRNFPGLLTSDGVMGESVWMYQNVVAWMPIPPFNPDKL